MRWPAATPEAPVVKLPVGHGNYSLYILRCADDSLYTGIARDVESRVATHERGAQGAKYTRGRGPLELVFEAPVGTRSRAQKLESKVKKLKRAQKQALVAGCLTLSEIERDQTSGSGRG